MNSDHLESTYALLVRSQEKDRNVTETLVYALLILSMVFSVWQVAQMRVTIPENLTPRSIAQNTAAQVDRA